MLYSSLNLFVLDTKSVQYININYYVLFLINQSLC